MADSQGGRKEVESFRWQDLSADKVSDSPEDGKLESRQGVLSGERTL